MAPVLSVVLPTYNEAANIGPMLEALRAELAGRDAELIVVDDDSPDGTAAAARAADPSARVIVRTDEKGLGTAVVRGIEEATGDYVLVMDTDFQHPPSVAPRMIDRALADDADLVAGTRYADGGTEGDFGLVRRTISRGASLMARVALPPVRQHNVSDPMSGLFLVRRSAVDTETLQPEGYKILLEVLAKGRLETVSEVGYRFDTRREGDSKLGAMVIVQYLVHLAMLGAAHPDNRRIAWFGLVGLSGVAVNLGLLYVLVDRFAFHYLLGALVSIEASIITNFLLNDRFTFRDRRRGHFLSRLARFNMVSAAALIINLATLFIFTGILEIHYLVSEAVAIVVSFGANYLGNVHWTYGGVGRFSLRQTGRRLAPWAPILIIAVAATSSYLYDLDRVDEVYFDEHYYLSVAYQMEAEIIEDPCWEGTELDHRPLNFEHPPLAKLIITWSVARFDPDHDVFSGCRDPDGNGKQDYDRFIRDLRDEGNPVAWRAPSAVFGGMTVLFAGIAAGRIARSPLAGTLAAGFVAMDGVVYTSSRLAILDIFAAAFAAAAFAAATVPGRRGIAMTAVALALGFASKWTVAFVGVPVFMLSLWTQHRHGRLNRRIFDGTLVSFVIVPNLLLLITYLPWLRHWRPIYGWFGMFAHWFDIIWAGLRWGVSVPRTHTWGVAPWEWFLLRKPTFYYAMWNVGGVGGLNRYIYAVGNPALWWAAAAMVVGLLVRAVRRRVQGAKDVLGPATMAALLPTLTYAAFMVLSRETFLYYMTIVVPPLAIALAVGLTALWNKGHAAGRLVVPIVVLLVFAAYRFYFPVVYGATIPEDVHDHIMGAVPWMLS